MSFGRLAPRSGRLPHGANGRRARPESCVTHSLSAYALDKIGNLKHPNRNKINFPLDPGPLLCSESLLWHTQQQIDEIPWVGFQEDKIPIRKTDRNFMVV